MNILINTFSPNQLMTTDSIEVYHYLDVRLDKVIPHTHTHYEFYFFLNGSTQYIINNHVFTLEKGDFLIIPPNMLHYPERILQDTKKPYERIIIWVNADYYNRIRKEDPSLNYMWEEARKINSWHIRPQITTFQHLKSLLFSLLEETTNQKLSYQIAMQSLFTQLLVCINRSIQEKSTFQMQSTSKNLYSQMITYIHQHIAEPISLKQLADEFYISTSYISKIFREHLGISAHQYILQLRLDKVLHAVTDGMGIAEAAYQYGFNDYSCFYKQFKKEFGISPKELFSKNV